ncbi:Phosphatidylglycerol lysyltransferase [Palleronia abyssalis]|uniref:Phosphatidylglycerol lysyltransferase n=2 Tax=Palleronia abyssalis TaxID=1501240 RepID=A0A2R8BUX3_9RHOB|nr:Phosphatidylglycerol lysyltransferase [Palleronia abyssalis]
MPLRGAILRQTLLAVPCLAIAWLCLSNLDLDAAAAIADLGDFGTWRWGVAAAFAALGFWAIGRYDRVLHRHMGTATPPALATRAGIAAIAVSQTTGFGLVVGAFIRRHLIPSLGLWTAARLSFYVSISFLAAWAVLAAAATLVLSPDLPGLRPLSVLILALAAAAIPVIAWRPGRMGRSMPSLRTAAAILPLAAADLLAAGMVLICFLPDAPGTQVLAAFVVAYGVGLVSGVPGGVGPFEATLIALLPGVDPATLLSAIVAYRVVYFAGPAILGLLVLLQGPRAAEAIATDTPLSPTDWRLNDPVQAEAGLARQGHMGLLCTPESARQVVTRTGHGLVHLAFLDRVLPGTVPDLLAGFATAAKESGRIACLYRIDARLAAAVRKTGWTVARTGAEAILDPTGWTIDGPARAQLRRKLKKALKAGVVLREVADLGPTLPELERIDRHWVAANSGARGVTMGRFDAEYVAAQRLFTAEIDGQVRAFVSFHTSAREWVLDLVRHDGAPDGTMHALVAHAIAAAGSEGCHRLSLASVPTAPRVLPARLRCIAERKMGTAGLRQFKTAFAPAWEGRYIAAPSALQLAIVWTDLAREIARPAKQDEAPTRAAPAGAVPTGITVAAVARPAP